MLDITNACALHSYETQTQTAQTEQPAQTEQTAQQVQTKIRYFPYTLGEVGEITNALTVWFESLPHVPSCDGLLDLYRGLSGRERLIQSDLSSKYIHWSSALGYRMARPHDALSCTILPDGFKKFISEEDCVIVMPSWDRVKNRVIGVTARSVFSKSFRKFTPLSYVPHGFLMSGRLKREKAYFDAWIVVESAFDSDWLRTIYPYVIASSGVSGLNTEAFTMVCETSSSLIIAFDNDEAGDDGYRNMLDRVRYMRNKPVIKRFNSPYKKDFGDIAQLALTDKRLYGIYSDMVLKSIELMTLC